MYEEWMEEGRRSVVRKALQRMEQKTVDAPRQISLTFRTQFPGVSIPDNLREVYPEEMVVALGSVFWNLIVQEDLFSVELLFNDQRKLLKVPFKALVNFMDADAKFGLKFDWAAAMTPFPQDNVIFLDQFRPPLS